MRSVPQPYRRIWLIILVVLLAVPALVITIVTLVGQRALTKATDNVTFTRGEWQPPTHALLSSPMQVRPVPGWRTTTTDLGVTDAAPSTPPLFANDPAPFRSDSYLGNVDDRAFFMVGNVGAPAPQWWLVAVDVSNGGRVFRPVPLIASHARPRCYLNGPDAVLCLTDDANDTTAWVINSHSGVVEYSGPTPLTVYSSRFIMQQVGIYAVAMKQYEGIYGIGPTANTSWFVPGYGTVDTDVRNPFLFAPPSLATQSAGRGADRTITFSLKDGTVVRPEIAAGQQQERAVTYLGGFAAEVAAPRGTTDVQFFDDTGRRAGRNSAPGTLVGSGGLPLVNLTGGGWALFNTRGEVLIQRAAPDDAQPAVIGDFLLISGDQPEDKHQYDLKSGAEMKACDLPSGYFASDGRVALGYHGYADTVRTLAAVDLTTCDTLWTTQSPVGSFRKLWRINTTLVQLSDDGRELMSLVAPS